ncbi:esterase-like activity of phytase family protein [Chitinimonas naiadis]
MPTRQPHLLATALIALLLAACATPPVHTLTCTAPLPSLAPTGIGKLSVLATTTLPRQATNTLIDFGGISGLDYNPQTQRWVMISDDRSQRAPARLYTADIRYGAAGFSRLEVLQVQPLRQADGGYFPSKREGGDVPDAESIRVDPCQGGLVWSSEGDRKLGLHPFIRRATDDGRYSGTIPLPTNLRMVPGQERGVRDNLALEGLTFTQGGKVLWTSMEAPRYQDGPLPSTEHGAYTRFSRIDLAGGNSRQYAYPLDAVPVAGSYGEKRADNGVSEILAIDDEHLLVIERSGHEVGKGAFEFDVRLYEATVTGASNVLDLPSLNGTTYTPLKKRLLLHLNQAGIGRIDNIEAASWGPRLPDGRATLLLASDDNFADNQVSQFILLTVDPAR